MYVTIFCSDGSGENIERLIDIGDVSEDSFDSILRVNTQQFCDTLGLEQKELAIVGWKRCEPDVNDRIDLVMSSPGEAWKTQVVVDGVPIIVNFNKEPNDKDMVRAVEEALEAVGLTGGFVAYTSE